MTATPQLSSAVARPRRFASGTAMMATAVFFAATGGTALAQSTQPNAEGSYSLVDPVPSDALPEMITDRPDRTDTPFTIAPGHLQIESFVATYTRDDRGRDGELQQVSVADTMFRLGVLPDLEIGAVVEPYVWQDLDAPGAGDSEGGFGITMVRAKYTFFGAPSDELALGLLAEVTLPTADGDGHDAALINSIAVEYKLTKKWAIFGEFYAEVNVEESSDWIGTVDAGLTYQLTDNVLLYSAAYVGVTEAADDLQFLVGFATRL